MQLKKIALVFLVVIMTFSLAAIGIAAEGPEFALSVKAESDSALANAPLYVKSGDVIKYVVSVDSNPGDLNQIQIFANFDVDVLHLEKITLGSIFDSDNVALEKVTDVEVANERSKAQVWVLADQDSRSDETGVFVTFEFKMDPEFDGEINDAVVSFEASYSLGNESLADYELATPAVHAHHYGEPTDEIGTCMTSANKVYTCTNEGCDEVLKVPTGVLGGHNCETLVDANAPTCDADGNVSYYVCANEGCGKYVAEDKTTVLETIVVPAKGHSCGDLVPAVAPTCAAVGNVSYYVCANEGCGKYIAEDKITVLESVEVAIAPNAHKCETLVPAVAPTCVDAGNVAYYVCANEGCGKYIAEDKTTVLETIVTPAKGHSYGDLVPAVEPTRKTEGNIAYYQCSECSKIFDENKNAIDSYVLPVVKSNTVVTIIIIVAAVLVLGAGAAAAVIVLKKKKII